MNTVHRYLVQYMLRNGVTTVQNALEFCKCISEGATVRIENITDLRTVVIEINREISKQFFKIVINTCEVTCQDMIIWLNTKNDQLSRLQNIYSALELEYFHTILQEILNSEDYKLTFIVCINITSTLTGFFSRDNGQNVLYKWIKAGYFVRKDSHVHLGPRLILEFTSYLKTHCPNSMCSLCSELVFSGNQCQSCHKMLHSYCLSKYLVNQKTCPCCHKRWSGTDFDLAYQSQNGHRSDDEEEVAELSSVNKSNDITEISQSEDSNNFTHMNTDSDENSNEPGPSTRRKRRR